MAQSYSRAASNGERFILDWPVPAWALGLLGRHRCARFARPAPAEQTQAAKTGGEEKESGG
jgi:hypothetical protein